jgi:tetratricopeptide (TPR) repeat protein
VKHRGHLVLAVGAWLLSLAGVSASEPSFKAMGPPKIWTANGWEPVPGNPDYTVGGGSAVIPRGPSQRELAAAEARERRAKATSFNESGLAAWNRGDWGVAAVQFQEAHAWNPDSKTIFNNLVTARYKVGWVAIEEGDWDYAADTFQNLSFLKPEVAEYKDLQTYAREKYREVEALRSQAAAAYERGDLRAAESALAAALKLRPSYQPFRHALAVVRNDLGREAWKRGEFAAALDFFERALQADPTDDSARENAGIARNYLQEVGRQKAAVAAAQQNIVQLADAIQRTTPAGGLNLDDLAPTGRIPAEPGNNPMVVNASNVPSGLPKAVDDVIAATYRNTPAAVSDRARKGFQAIAARDWKVARAWFQDALNRDPGNAELKRMVDLADSTEKFHQNAADQNAALLAQPQGSPELAAAIQAKAKGDAVEAIRQLERTKVVYPESAARVDRMITEIRRQQAGAAVMADYQREQADFVVQLEQDSLNFLLLGNLREADRLSRDAAFFAAFVDAKELEAANARLWGPATR